MQDNDSRDDDDDVYGDENIEDDYDILIVTIYETDKDYDRLTREALILDAAPFLTIILSQFEMVMRIMGMIRVVVI